MYQTLIWAAVLGNDARRLAPALDAEDVERAADALVDGVRRDMKFGRDFLGRKMLVDQPQAIELARAEPRNAARNQRFNLCGILRSRCGVGHQASPKRNSARPRNAAESAVT
jgi:hypothetical protein